MTAPVILWLRRELRLADNAALAAAIASGRPVLPVFVLDDETPGAWKTGAAASWWLHKSLESLAASLAAKGAPLILRSGKFAEIIPALMAETGAAELHCGLPTEPWSREAYRAVKTQLGARMHVHMTSLAYHPDAIRTQTGTPYGVYTPFSRACRAYGPPPAPLPAPDTIQGATAPSDSLADWHLLPTKPDWSPGLAAAWTPGEPGAHVRLQDFLASALAGYATQRDRPDIESTSRLSPHLTWGEISPGQIWHAATEHGGKGLEKFLNEVLWREFAASLLWHNPTLPDAPLKPDYARMPWRDAPADLAAWQKGRTGIPIVDAGMRQLWQTGWMHNRVRMIVASFLIKHLMLPWQAGEAWFWDTLVDADLAQNAASWQWVAGSGADAAPYFRIFNPVLQGLKFDPAGAYVKRYVPELAALPTQFIHTPWDAPPFLRRSLAYPAPIVDLAEGRARALAAFAALKPDAA